MHDRPPKSVNVKPTTDNEKPIIVRLLVVNFSLDWADREFFALDNPS
jgi:hypothetical protein